MDQVPEIRMPVLIVGGSLNGLSLAVFLSAQNVRCMVVERHAATTVQYKFAGINPRSMEIYRGFGLEQTIRAHRTGDQKSGEIARARNFADPDVHFMGKPWAAVDDLTAATAETCDQDKLEPLLQNAAEDLGADIRFSTELVAFAEADDVVVARFRDLATGEEYEVRADYLVAADGGAGHVRSMLGIGWHGSGALQHWMNLIFDTDMEPCLKQRRFTSCFVTDVNGSFTPREDRWLLAVQYDPESGESRDGFDADHVRALVRAGAGDRSVRADLFDARSWEVAALVADRFRQRRCFLVGDAAHLMPPTGGFGGNTGIQDGYNLAWKLAAVVSGAAEPRLLDSYDAERRPVADHTLAQAMARLSAWFEDPGRKLPDPEPIVDEYWVMFGQIYPDGAFVGRPVGVNLPFENPREPSATPGTRAPHIEVTTQGGTAPLHDIVAKGDFVLLTGRGGESWESAVTSLGFGAPIRMARVTNDRRFENLYRTQSRDAVLVRPDGVIAWRSADSLHTPSTLACAWEDIGMRAQART